jgi:DNA-directed RNA polymerase subunit RPC12/RpoP
MKQDITKNVVADCSYCNKKITIKQMKKHLKKIHLITIDISKMTFR